MSLDACTQQNRTKETLSQQGGKMKNNSKKNPDRYLYCPDSTYTLSLSHTHTFSLDLEA